MFPLHFVVVVYLLSCVWLFSNTTDCTLPGSSVHGISQAGILECIGIYFSRGSSHPRDQTWVQVDSLPLSHQGNPVPLHLKTNKTHILPSHSFNWQLNMPIIWITVKSLGYSFNFVDGDWPNFPQVVGTERRPKNDDLKGGHRAVWVSVSLSSHALISDALHLGEQERLHWWGCELPPIALIVPECDLAVAQVSLEWKGVREGRQPPLSKKTLCMWTKVEGCRAFTEHLYLTHHLAKPSGDPAK